MSNWNLTKKRGYTQMFQKLPTPPVYLSSPPVFSGVRVTRSLVFYVCFVDRCLSFCTFSFGHCVVCTSSIYEFWLPLWYLQTLLPQPIGNKVIVFVFSMCLISKHDWCIWLVPPPPPTQSYDDPFRWAVLYGGEIMSYSRAITISINTRNIY